MLARARRAVHIPYQRQPHDERNSRAGLKARNKSSADAAAFWSCPGRSAARHRPELVRDRRRAFIVCVVSCFTSVVLSKDLGPEVLRPELVQHHFHCPGKLIVADRAEGEHGVGKVSGTMSTDQTRGVGDLLRALTAAMAKRLL